MSYYHVIIQLDNGSSWTCIFKDLRKNELKNKFTKNYKLGKDIFIGNTIIQTMKISGLRIIKTHQDHKTELALLQQQDMKDTHELNQDGSVFFMPAGWGLYDDHIQHRGDDVTTEYITSAPGQGSVLSKFNSSISAPIIVTVVGGLLLALLIAWLKIK